MGFATYPLSTIYGEDKTTIGLTDGTHAFVNVEHGKAVTINRVQYRFNAHLFLQSDGSWKVGREEENSYQKRQHVYASRFDKYENITEAAREKLIDQLQTSVTNFLRNNPSIIQDAQREHLRAEMEKAEHVYAEAVATADKALVARTAAQEAYEAFL
jgi:uridine kinase